MKIYTLERESTGRVLDGEVTGRALRVHRPASVLFIQASCARRGLVMTSVQNQKDGCFDIAIVCTKAQLEEVRREFNTRPLL